MLRNNFFFASPLYNTLGALFKNKCRRSFSYLREKNTFHTNQCSEYNLNMFVNNHNISLNNYIKRLEQEYKMGNLNEARKSKLQPVMNLLEIRKDLLTNLASLNELLNETDEALKKLAEEEKYLNRKQLKEVDEKLLENLFLTVNEDDDYDSVVLEINAGVGGQEAMLFAKELFDMYSNFSQYKGWNFQVAEYSTSELGGLRFGSALVDGDLVFQYLKHEAGVHRVQRIPATEKSGRIHTSTVAVVAMPQPNDIQVHLETRDLKIETKRAAGAGGQHVNTTDSAVRILHLPTGIAVDCQVDRSQIKNKQIALIKLRTLLYQKQLDERIQKAESTRRSQVRSNFRNEKIRTYNFSQDRITDHRLQGENVHNLKTFMQGGPPLEELIDKLLIQSKQNNLLNVVKSLNL